MAYKKGLGSLLLCIAPNFFKLAIRKQHVVHYTAMMKMRMMVLERANILLNEITNNLKIGRDFMP